MYWRCISGLLPWRTYDKVFQLYTVPGPSGSVCRPMIMQQRITLSKPDKLNALHNRCVKKCWVGDEWTCVWTPATRSLVISHSVCQGCGSTSPPAASQHSSWLFYFFSEWPSSLKLNTTLESLNKSDTPHLFTCLVKVSADESFCWEHLERGAHTLLACELLLQWPRQNYLP